MERMTGWTCPAAAPANVTSLGLQGTCRKEALEATAEQGAQRSNA